MIIVTRISRRCFGSEHGVKVRCFGGCVQVIVDMRGPQPKLLTRTDEINYDAEDEEVTEEEPPKLGRCEAGQAGRQERLW